MHITNQKLSFDTIMVGNTQNIFMEHDLNILKIFGIKEKSVILIHTSVFLAITTNIPQRLNTAFVLQGHIYRTSPIILPLQACSFTTIFIFDNQ